MSAIRTLMRIGGPLGLVLMGQLFLTLNQRWPVATEAKTADVAVAPVATQEQPGATAEPASEVAVKSAIRDLALARCSHFKREGVNLLEHDIYLHGAMSHLQAIGDNGEGIQGSATANAKTAPLLIDKLALEYCRQGEGDRNADYRFTLEDLIYER